MQHFQYVENRKQILCRAFSGRQRIHSKHIWTRETKKFVLDARFKGKNKGGPKLRWIDNINDDITSLGLTIKAVYLTTDRGYWRSFIPTHHCTKIVDVRN